MIRDEILAEASRLINGDRADDYGSAAVQFARLAERWNQFPRPLEPHHVGLMLIDLKVVRGMTSTKADTFVDLAGYAALAGEVAAYVGIADECAMSLSDE